MRPSEFRTSPLFFGLILVCALARVGPVFAQSADEAEAMQEAQEQAERARAMKEAKRKAPPTALPGGESDETGDMGHALEDVHPTLALFDAINRGSITAAKEAIGRGADLRAKNVLGQTPIDMAIDLNRNDIMFLLLSLRSYNGQGQIITHVSEADRRADMHIEQMQAVRRRSETIARPVVRNSPPDPQAGFLGFH